jgi:hypothetical protein
MAQCKVTICSLPIHHFPWTTHVLDNSFLPKVLKLSDASIEMHSHKPHHPYHTLCGLVLEPPDFLEHLNLQHIMSPHYSIHLVAPIAHLSSSQKDFFSFLLYVSTTTTPFHPHFVHSSLQYNKHNS